MDALNVSCTAAIDRVQFDPYTIDATMKEKSLELGGHLDIIS
jgi:hypothetical protein